jgi:hypothetical protein
MSAPRSTGARALALGGLLTLGLLAFGLIARALAAREPGGASPPAGEAADEILLLAAHPFAVDEPFAHNWRAERPRVAAGYLLVLQVAPELARARQTFERVLYVGAETAQRCNAPEQGGRLVVLVPAPLDEDGAVALDPAAVPIWFGSPELPERVDAARVASELAAALRRGLGPARVAPAARLASGAGATIHARSRAELQAYVDDLIAAFSAPSPDGEGAVRPR